MSPLLETIKIMDGRFNNLEFHNLRFNEARRIYFGKKRKLCLEELINVPDEFRKGLYRCRVIYAPEIKKIEFIPHKFRIVRSLKLIEDNNINYAYKFLDRNELLNLFEKRGDCDDILIVKNGLITDSFAANAIFFDGEKWWTPESPLLKGTQRERLLHEKQIFERKITPGDLEKYQSVGLINALQELDNKPKIDIKSVKW